MNYLQKKIDKWCPPHYKAIWLGNPNEPLRFKLCNKNVSIKTLNMIWAEVLSSVTGNRYIENEHYTRIHANIGKGTIAISIFPTGTVMFQGKCSLSWLHKNIVCVCKRVKSVAQKPGLSLTTLSDSPIISPEIPVEGLCMVCNKLDTGEMLQCQDSQCCSWTHNHCENLTEDEAQTISPYYCLNCRKKTENDSLDGLDTNSSSDENLPSNHSTPVSISKLMPSPKNVNLEIENMSSSLSGLFSSQNESFFHTLKEPMVFESNRQPTISEKNFQISNLNSKNSVKSFTEQLKCTPISKGVAGHSRSLPIYWPGNDFISKGGTANEKLTCFTIETDNFPLSSPVPLFDLNTNTPEVNKQTTSTPKDKISKLIFSRSSSTILEDPSGHDIPPSPNSPISQVNSKNVSCTAKIDQDISLSRLKIDTESKEHDLSKSLPSEINLKIMSQTAVNGQDVVQSKLQEENEPTLSITQAIKINAYLQERISKLLEENLQYKNLLHQQDCDKKDLEKVIENLRGQGNPSYGSEEHQIPHEELLKNYEQVKTERDILKEQTCELKTENGSLKQQNHDFQMELAICYCEVEKFRDICDRKEREINNILNPPKEINSKTILINDDDYITRSQIISREVDESVLAVDSFRRHATHVLGSNGVALKNNFNVLSQKTRVFYRKGYDSQKFENHALDFENFKQNKSFQEQLGINISSLAKNKTIINISSSTKNKTIITRSTPLDENDKKVCWYAQNNKCKFGNRCWNFHPPKQSVMLPVENFESTGGGQFPNKQTSQVPGANTRDKTYSSVGPYPESTTVGHIQTTPKGKTYSSVLKGCLGDVGGSQPAPSDQQFFSNKCLTSLNPIQYSDLMGGYKSFVKNHNLPNHPLQGNLRD